MKKKLANILSEIDLEIDGQGFKALFNLFLKFYFLHDFSTFRD